MTTELDHADDWYCAKCNWGPHSDADDNCKNCGVPVKCDPLDSYNDKLDADQQISTEEQIAFLIFDGVREDEGCDVLEQRAGDLGRDILKMVLKEFRPDLFTKEN